MIRDGKMTDQNHAMMSTSLEDMTVPGVMVEVDADEAESMGAFVETALTESEAWDANIDVASSGGSRTDLSGLPSIRER